MSSGLHLEYLLFLSYFNKTWNFLDIFSKNTQISTFMKIRPVGAQLFHVDGQRDSRTDAFPKARNKEKVCNVV
jgi:hypothetical protein